MPARRRAFTIIELLVVIITILVLMGIVVAVTNAARRSGQLRSTEGTIGLMENALQAFITETGDTPPSLVVAPDPINSADGAVYPVFDGTVDPTGAAEPSELINASGLFVAEAENEGLADLFTDLDPELYTLFDPDGAGGEQPSLRTPLDPWGNPLRFVHPRFDGVLISETVVDTPMTQDDLRQLGGAFDFIAEFDIDVADLPQGFRSDSVGDALGFSSMTPQLRRNAGDWTGTGPDAEINPAVLGDSDGGAAPSNRPYIYSAGPDGNPATTEDNVYVTRPTFAIQPGA